jgi:hypothetical protein
MGRSNQSASKGFIFSRRLHGHRECDQPSVQGLGVGRLLAELPEGPLVARAQGLDRRRLPGLFHSSAHVRTRSAAR